MKLCIHNKNLFRVSISNDELMKNGNLNKLFDFKDVVFNNKDNLQLLIKKKEKLLALVSRTTAYVYENDQK